MMLILAMAVSLGMVGGPSSAQADRAPAAPVQKAPLIPPADLDPCTAYYLGVAQKAPKADTRNTLELAGWMASLTSAMARNGATPEAITAHMRELLKTGMGSMPPADETALRTRCDADEAAAKARLKAANDARNAPQ
jgi:hypothetical protein